MIFILLKLLSKEDTTTTDIENVLQELEKASKEEEYLEEDPSRIELIIQALIFSAQANDSSPKVSSNMLATDERVLSFSQGTSPPLETLFKHT